MHAASSSTRRIPLAVVVLAAGSPSLAAQPPQSSYPLITTLPPSEHALPTLEIAWPPISDVPSRSPLVLPEGQVSLLHETPARVAWAASEPLPGALFNRDTTTPAILRGVARLRVVVWLPDDADARTLMVIGRGLGRARGVTGATITHGGRTRRARLDENGWIALGGGGGEWTFELAIARGGDHRPEAQISELAVAGIARP